MRTKAPHASSHYRREGSDVGQLTGSQFLFAGGVDLWWDEGRVHNSLSYSISKYHQIGVAPETSH